MCDDRIRSRHRKCPGSNPHGYSKTPQFGGERNCLGDPNEDQSFSSAPYCSSNELVCWLYLKYILANKTKLLSKIYNKSFRTNR